MRWLALAPPPCGGRLAWPAPRAWVYPNPAFPPYTVRTLHFHGGPATEDTTRTGACAALALILRGASSPQDPEAAPEQPRGPQMSPGHRAVRSRSCSKPAAKRPSKLILAAPAIAPYVRGAAQNPALTPLFKRCWETRQNLRRTTQECLTARPPESAPHRSIPSSFSSLLGGRSPRRTIQECLKARPREARLIAAYRPDSPLS